MPNDLVLQPPAPAASLAAIRRWPSDDARRWVAALLDEAAADPRFLAIVAYGSAVRDVPASEDVDLLYVYEGDTVAVDAPLFDVDLRGYAAGTLDERIASGDEVLGWSLRLGVPLFERDSYWTTLRARWKQRLPLPSAADAERRADRAFEASAGLADGGDEEAARDLRLSALTQQGRARLIRSGVYPRSRPELPQQLASIGERDIAAELSLLLAARG